ncbi:MAG: pyridine nucleotide-disulfide oxidoreductase [Acidimicrobiia bacterium]|nr:MAG: pyridine nucleotide-disulfide oxidoreductase [Acidimicrobiia bacterium]
MTGERRPRVVVVGAGFAGLSAAKALAPHPVDVTLIDRHNHHTFFPLLYQVAAAELQPGDVAYPIRAIVRRMGNVDFRMGTVRRVDPGGRRIDVDGNWMPYDHLILAVGSVTNWFGIPGAEEHAWPLRTLDQAVALRNHILRCFERSTWNVARRTADRTVVVVGGGPTGVELAGALAELIRGPLGGDIPGLDDARVILLEAGGDLLPTYPPRLRSYALTRLRRMGVEVRVDSPVAEVSEHGARLETGGTVEASTVVWTAGVGGPPDLAVWGLPTGRGGRVEVRPDLSVVGAEGVWVVGDAALPVGVDAPMVAPNAQQQGSRVAENVMRTLQGLPTVPYRYRDLGQMAVIGRNAAVVDLFGRIRLRGFLAWTIWLGLHLLKLVGFRNRLAAMISWAGDYLVGDRAARLIIPSER